MGEVERDVWGRYRKGREGGEGEGRGKENGGIG